MTDKKEISLDEAKQASELEAKMLSQYSGDRDMLNQMIGRHQMADTFSKIGNVASLNELRYIKEHKLYKAMRDSENGDVPHNWGSFCKALGTSRRKIDEDLLNIHVLGEDTVQSMNQSGITIRQLRQLRSLPEDQVEQAKTLAKEGDVDSLKDLIEEQAVEKAKLKEALEKSEKEQSQIEKANQNIMARKDGELNTLKTKLEKRENLEGDELHQELELDVSNALGDVMGSLLVLNKAIENIQFKGELYPEHLRGVCHQSLERIRSRLRDIELENDVIAIVSDQDDLNEKGMPVWAEED